MKIDSTVLKGNNLIYFSKFKDYATFNYEKREQENNKNQNIDLNEKDICEIENILNPVFRNKANIKEYNKYIKQVVGYENSGSKEKYACVKCLCRDKYNLINFRKRLIDMKDGGECNIYIILNLTKKKIEIFSVAGIA